MKVSEAYPSRYLSVGDLDGKPMSVVIESAELEEIGQGKNKENKIVLTFKGQGKSLVCNKTNSQAIASMHGEDTDDWIGKTVKLVPREVEFQGDTVWAIRVSTKPPTKSAPRTQEPDDMDAPF